MTDVGRKQKQAGKTRIVGSQIGNPVTHRSAQKAARKVATKIVGSQIAKR